MSSPYEVSETVALQRLDQAASQLQKEGRFFEALECMERGLVLRQRMFGVRDERVRRLTRITLRQICNVVYSHLEAHAPYVLGLAGMVCM